MPLLSIHKGIVKHYGHVSTIRLKKIELLNFTKRLLNHDRDGDCGDSLAIKTVTLSKFV